jgi:hypothetical protein
MGNKLKIKLLRPPTITTLPANIRLPYGMGVISATLKVKGYEVEQDNLFARVKDFNNNLKSLVSKL